MPTVVLVEDDRELRAMVSRILGEHGFTVIVSSDALGALAGIRSLSRPPDLVLVDRRVAEGTERELVEWMRSFRWFQDVPMVLFTAHGFAAADDSSLEKLRDAFDADLLLAVVEGIFHSPAG